MKLCRLLLALLAVGCAPLESEDVGADPDEVVVGSATEAFSTSALKWVNGTYSNCASRSGAWSARVSGSATMDNPALTVVKNDSGCQLVLTSVVADQTYAASPTISLTTSYAGSSSTFGSGGSLFMGNAKLDSSFAADFSMTFVYEDRSTAPTITDSLVSASYTSVTTSSVTASSTLASNYAIDTSTLKFAADPIKLIYGVNGSAILSGASVGQTGTSYRIDTGGLSATPTWTDVDNAYSLALLTHKTISSQPITIPAADFGVVTLSLVSTTVVRNIIVRRFANGNAAYQVFRITFTS